MIHVITEENRSEFRSELLAMHRQRKAVFVDQMKWPLPCEEGLEIDEFDADDVTYLLYFDEGRLRASARMLPTDRPHLLGSMFADLCPDGVPAGPAIWESTRFCPHPDSEPEQRRWLLGVMIAGMMEAALLFGVEQITFVAGGALKPVALAAGWEARALGPTARRSRDRITACAAAVTPQGLREVRARHGLVRPLISYAPRRRRAA